MDLIITLIFDINDVLNRNDEYVLMQRTFTTSVTVNQSPDDKVKFANLIGEILNEAINNGAKEIRKGFGIGSSVILSSHHILKL